MREGLWSKRIAKAWRAQRAAQIKALRGRYRHALTPTDDFVGQKQEEITRAAKDVQ